MLKFMMYTVLFLTSITVWAWAEPREISANVTVLNLSADASQTVMPDTLTATLRIEKKADTPAEVQAYINKKMQDAQATAKREKDVKFITGHYHVNERWEYPEPSNRKKRYKKWYGSQTVSLEGKTFADVLEIAGKLQAKDFAISNISYSLSRQVRESFQENLMAEALQNIQVRAKRFGKILSKPTVHFADINVNQSVPRHYQHHKVARSAMMMSADVESAPTPVASPDDMTLSATVNATVWLK